MSDAPASWWDRPLGVTATLSREQAAWGGVLALAVISRFVDLGARVMGHDESIHAFLSLQLSRSGLYRHDPAYHGPLLYHATALVFWLLGAGDAIARVLPALAGVALVAGCRVFRRDLGATGALATAVLVLVSPTLTFYSRYLRNDVDVALFTLFWVHGMARYLEDRRPRWLALVTGAMAASVLSKEVAFITGAILGAFAAGLWAWQAGRGRRWRAESPAGDLAVLMLTLVLPFAAAPALALAGFDARDYAAGPGLARSAAMVALLLGASTLIAWLWFGGGQAARERLRSQEFRQWAGLMAGFWLPQVLFFSTFLTNAPGGLASGIVGSLGYWLGQQAVGRGGQPWFYYLLLGLLYEFLPGLLAAGGVVAALRILAARARASGASSPGLGAGEPAPRATVVALWLWWAVGSWVAYGIAREKMPWLLVHMVLPLCVLGGFGMSRLLEAIDWRRVGALRAAGLALGGPLWLVVAARATRVPALAGRELDALAGVPAWLAGVLLACGLAGLGVRALRTVGRAAGWRLLALGVVAAAALLTVRATVRLTYVDYDLPTELLSYAQGAPDIKRAMAEIELIGQRTGEDGALEIAYGEEVTWPWVWYLRDYRRSRLYVAIPAPETLTAPVILLGPTTAARLDAALRDRYIDRRYRLMWWPFQGYATRSPADLGRMLVDPAARAWLWRVALDRRYPGFDLSDWPLQRRFTMYVRRDLAARVWLLGPGPPPAIAPDRRDGHDSR